MTETPDESDQLPEEGPGGQTPDDGAAKGGRHDSPGTRGDDDTGTGNPGAAGSDEGGGTPTDHPGSPDSDTTASRAAEGTGARGPGTQERDE